MFGTCVADFRGLLCSGGPTSVNARAERHGWSAAGRDAGTHQVLLKGALPASDQHTKCAVDVRLPLSWSSQEWPGSSDARLLLELTTMSADSDEAQKQLCHCPHTLQ